MKAMMLRKYGKPLGLEDMPIPQPGPNEMLVKVGACGICGTDIKISSGNLPGLKFL